MRWISIGVVAVVLSGCATGALAGPEYQTAVEVEDDRFAPSIKLVGVEESTDGNRWHRHFLRSWIDRDSGAVSHQVYVMYSYGGDWRYYVRASAPGGSSLEFLRIDRDVDCSRYGCTYYEEFAVTLPDDLLREHRETGYQLKVFARSGHDLLVAISSRQINMQLEEIDGLVGPR